MISQHFGALEADFQREYGLDLREVVFGPSPWGARRLWVRVKHLPPKSALAREINPEGAAWGNVEELLATLVEVVDWGNRNFHAVHSKRRTKITPIKIPRPKRRASKAGKKQPKAQSDPEKMLAFFGSRLRVVEEK